MRNYAVLIFTLLIVSTAWGASSPATPVDNTSRPAASNEVLTPQRECEINQITLDAIYSAKESVIDAGSNTDAFDLIDEAEAVAGPPECDSVRARILADKAVQLARSRKITHSPESTHSRFKSRPTGWRIADDCMLLPDELRNNTVEMIVYSTSTLSMTTWCIFTSPAISTTTITVDNKTAYLRMQKYRFVTVNRDNLAKDIAQGEGEYVTTMAYLEGCPTEFHDNFAQMTQHNFNQIFPKFEIGTETILLNLEAQIAKDPLLSAECSQVS